MNEAGKKYLKSELILSCLYFVAGGGEAGTRFIKTKVEASIDHLSQYLVLRLGSDLGLVPDNIDGDEVSCLFYHMLYNIYNLALVPQY